LAFDPRSGSMNFFGSGHVRNVGTYPELLGGVSGPIRTKSLESDVLKTKKGPSLGHGLLPTFKNNKSHRHAITFNSI